MIRPGRRTVALVGPMAARGADRLKAGVTSDWTVRAWLPEDGVAAREALLGEADALIAGKPDFDLPRGGRLKLFQIPFAGHHWFDAADLPPGCAFCNTFEHEPAIAEYVLTAMLSWSTRFHAIAADFKAGSWRFAGPLYGERHGELMAKSVGLVGYGHIGQAIAARAAPFGVRLAAVTRHGRPARASLGPLARLEPVARGLDRLLAESDFVVIACPLDNRTRGLIGRRELGLMRPAAVLINVARAAIVDQGALYDVLARRRIGGAVLDVWYRYPDGQEPGFRPADLPFHELDNVVMTPHSSGWTDAQQDRRWARVAENLDRLATGRPLLNVVQPAA